MCCVIVQAQRFSFEDLSEDLTLPGMGIATIMWHMRPIPTQRNRRAPPTVFAPVTEEQPLFDEEEEDEDREGEEEGEKEKEEEARIGDSDAQDEGGQAGEHCMSSQFLM